MRFVTFLFGLFLIAISLIIWGGLYYKGVVFEQNCSGYLKLAADANNVELASSRLDTAINYLEDKGLTKGNSGILFSVPANDLEAWYGNLKAAQKNLHTFPANSSETDQGVTLVKLHETLLDKGKDGEHVTMPSYIQAYPNQLLWVFLTMIALVPAFFGVFMFMMVFDEKIWP